jgi:hypothetical protein
MRAFAGMSGKFFTARASPRSRSGALLRRVAVELLDRQSLPARPQLGLRCGYDIEHCNVIRDVEPCWRV